MRLKKRVEVFVRDFESEMDVDPEGGSTLKKILRYIETHIFLEVSTT